MTWKRFPHYRPFVSWLPLVTGRFSSQRTSNVVLRYFFGLSWSRFWTNSCSAGDLSRHVIGCNEWTPKLYDELQTKNNTSSLWMSIQWHHNEHDGVSNHRRLDGLFNRLFSRISQKTSNLSVTGLSEGTPPVTGGFPSQEASNAENVSIWWCHHGKIRPRLPKLVLDINALDPKQQNNE